MYTLKHGDTVLMQTEEEIVYQNGAWYSSIGGWVDLEKVYTLEYKEPVPQIITKLQAMKQMRAIGKWESFKTVLANDEDVNDEWVLSDNLNRTYPLVLGIGQLFGFTDDDMDNFFIEASKVV